MLVWESDFCYFGFVRIFKNTWFARFADKEGIIDSELKEVLDHLESGQVDADFGGGVYKMRIARHGEGKSSGYRVILFFRSHDRAFYQYVISKSDRDNINPKELHFYKKLAKIKLNMSDDEIAHALKTGELIEV